MTSNESTKPTHDNLTPATPPLPTGSAQVTGKALDQFTRVRGIGPFRLLWKRSADQYFSRGPDGIDLVSGARTASVSDILRYGLNSAGSYSMDGLTIWYFVDPNSVHNTGAQLWDGVPGLHH